jgi:dynein heavy chain
VDVPFEEVIRSLLAEISNTLTTVISGGLQQYTEKSELDIKKLKAVLLGFLECRQPHQVVLLISWTLMASLVQGRSAARECKEQLSQLIEFVAPLQKCRADESLDKLRQSPSTTNNGPIDWEPWQITILRDIVLIVIYYRDLLAVLDQNDCSNFSESFPWYSSLKYTLLEGETIPVLECGGASIPYGLQYTGLHSSLLLPPQTERCLFSLIQAVNLQSIALCLGADVTAKRDCYFTLSDLSGHVPYSYVCSASTRFVDINDVLVATARTGSWLFVQGIDSLHQDVCISTLSVLHTLASAICSHMAEVEVGSYSVSVEGSPFFAVSTECPLGTRSKRGFCIPTHQAMQYRCVSCSVPSYKAVLVALLTAAGFTNQIPLLDSITALISSLSSINLDLHITPKMLQELINLATKHQDMLINTGSLTSLYTDTADYLRVYSETYLQKRIEEAPSGTEVPLPAEYGANMSTLAETRQPPETLSTVPVTSPSPVVPMGVLLEANDQLSESPQEERLPAPTAGEVDNSLLLTEQFAIMLALKDSLLPAFGGASTEVGKKFVNLLGTIFPGLSIDKVIQEEMEVLLKAKSLASHQEMIDSLRESRAGSALGKALSPALKIPISLEEAIVGACKVLELEPTLSFQSNVIQFIQLVQAHKMIVVVGPPCCGKTSCATVGAEALKLLGYSVLYNKVNLNCGTQSSLTGSWDDEGQWKGGILCSVLENILLRLASKKESPEEPQWLIVDGPCSFQELLKIIHPDGLLKVPNKKAIKLPSELKIIVESSEPVAASIPMILMSSTDIGWDVMLKVEVKKAKFEDSIYTILREAVLKVITYLDEGCADPKQLAVITVKLFQGLCARMRSGSAAVHRLTALLAVAWVAKYYTTNFSSEEWEYFLRKQLDEAGSPLASGLTFYECGVDHETVTMVPWKHAPKTTSRFPSKFIHTPMTLAYHNILGMAVDQCIPVLLTGTQGSGKSSFAKSHLQKYTSSPVGNVKSIIVNISELSTPVSLVNRLLENMTWRAGHTYVPTGAKKLICLLDNVHKVLKSPDGQGILEILRQHIMEGGFHHPGNHQWYQVADVSYILISDSNWELDQRLLHHCLILDWTNYSIDDIQCIYMQVLDKVHVDTSSVISTQDVVQKIVDVSVDLHKQVQRLFQGKVHFGIVFTFCDLARMFQRIEASLDIIHTLEDLLLLWQHESYWTYAGKLSSDADVARYLDTFGMALKKQFSNIPMTEFLYGYKHCVLPPQSFSNQLSFVQLTQTNHKKLLKYFSDHMTEVQKTTPVPSIIFCTQMVEEMCHLVKLLNGEYSASHVLLVGHSNPQPLVSVLGHIIQFNVVRLSNLPVTAAKLATNFGPNGLNYDVQQFRQDIISLCIETGAKGEKVLLYISDEDIQTPFRFLVYIEDLMNNCSITHLFTDEEKSHAINLVRGHVNQAGIEFSVEVAWKFFLGNIMKNLRIVMSVTNTPPRLLSWIADNHPSLLRIVNLVSHCPWKQSDLLEVAELHLADSTLDLSSNEKQKLSHMLSSMHMSLLDQPVPQPCVNNWTYKYFVERFSCELRVFHEAKSQQTSTLSKAIMCIEDAEAELVSLERTLGQEMEQLEEKKYACVKLLGQTGQDTAIAAEHEKFLLRLKERINHLEKMIPEYQHAYQVSVGKTAQLTADTKELVRSMDKDSLTQLRAQHSPSKEVEMLLSAVIIVVKSPNADLTWTKGAKRLMANIDRFLEMLSTFDETSTRSDTLLTSLDPYMNLPALDVSYHEQELSPDSVLDICQWINNVISYHQMLETKVKPLQDKLDSMQQFLEDLKKRLITWNEKMVSYNERLKGMRISFEELSVDKCLYEEHVHTIQKQLGDVKKFVQLLGNLKETWNQSIQDNQEARSVHFGSLAFVVGYAVYLSKVPLHTRSTYLQQIWPACLRSCGVQLTWPKLSLDGVNFLNNPTEPSPSSVHPDDNDGSPPFSEGPTINRMYLSMSTHLTKVLDVLLLLQEGWTGSEILDYLIVSTSWKQSVILLDPEEVGVKWITRLYGDNIVSMDGRQVDQAFLHSLEVAMTTGQPTLIRHMCPSVDPVLMSVIEFAEFASGNAGVYVLFCGKRLSVHSNFRLFLSTSVPLDQLETKLVSSTTVLDLTLCKNEMVHLLSSKNSAKVDELPDTKALLDKYFEGMHNVMELMNISKQNRYCGEAVLADLEKQIQCLTEIRSTISSIDIISNTPGIYSMDLLNSQTLLLYVFTTLLTSTGMTNGISLQQWVRLISQVTYNEAGSTSDKLSQLFKGILTLGARVFRTIQWNMLLAGCSVLCSTSVSPELHGQQSWIQLPPASDLPVGSGDGNEHLHFPSLCSLLEDFITSAPTKPILMIHEEGSLHSDIIRCKLEEILNKMCKEREVPYCNLDLSVTKVDDNVESLSVAHCMFIDVGQASEQDLIYILGKLRQIRTQNCTIFLLCEHIQLSPCISCNYETVLLGNLRLSKDLDIHLGQSERMLAVQSTMSIVHVLLSLSSEVVDVNSMDETCFRILFNLSALHSHVTFLTCSQQSERCPMPVVSLFLYCLRQIKYFSDKDSVSARDIQAFASYVQEVYCAHVTEDVDVLAYISSSDSVQVGIHTVPVPDKSTAISGAVCSTELADIYQSPAQDKVKEVLENIIPAVFTTVKD